MSLDGVSYKLLCVVCVYKFICMFFPDLCVFFSQQDPFENTKWSCRAFIDASTVNAKAMQIKLEICISLRISIRISA